MKQWLKRLAVLGIVILVPILFNIAIMCVNDFIADGMEGEILACALPENTELLDSISIAAKVYGNGNGMQYNSGILVRSDLNEEELMQHYEKYVQGFKERFGMKPYLSVERMETPIIFEYQDYSFDNWQSGGKNYRIFLTIETIVGCEETLGEALLNMDLRGH